jgi:hypothetical protein
MPDPPSRRRSVRPLFSTRVIFILNQAPFFSELNSHIAICMVHGTTYVHTANYLGCILDSTAHPEVCERRPDTAVAVHLISIAPYEIHPAVAVV